MEDDISNILVAPLDWGLGHATRCVPLIHKLKENNHNVILAADGRSWDFLHQEFPDLMLIRLPGHKISYPAKGSFLFKMLGTIPGFYRMITREHRFLKKIIKEHNIDAVISDNRYGLWSRQVPTVFIGHQMMIKLPPLLKWSEWFVHKISLYFIKRFEECWIPDYKGKINLSGDLAHKYKLPDNYYFIGPLTRFFHNAKQHKINEEFENGEQLLVILSGPEPQRSILEKKILKQLENSEQHGILVRGVTEKSGEYQLNQRIRVIHHANTEQMKKLISESDIVICRPGYSSIMDLTASGKKAIFIPTPGQTEQQYLAQYFYKNKIFYYNTQRAFDLETALERSADFEGIQMRYNPSLLEDRIEALEEKINLRKKAKA